ncbi:MAG: sugar ABC transporter permease [Lachnospiraceae bacterium]|nr:sugar ABC transporter permease [Lachnospiraceae bacterium]
MKKKAFHKQFYGYLFISPFFIIFLIFGLYPIVSTALLSMQKWDGMLPPDFNGIDNYARLITDTTFFRSVGNTIRIWLFNFIPQMAIALLLAALFTFNRVRGMILFRAAFYMPNLITAASVGLMFNLLFNGGKSAVNHLLLMTGIIDTPIYFFESPFFTSSLVSYIQWWMWFGYTTIIVMTGMASIDTQVYEAAMVDGASKRKTFFAITLPLIRPTLIYMTITSIIGGMQIFDVPATLTNGTGEPQKSILTTAMYIYIQAFRSHNLGYASAVSMGLFLMIALLSMVSFRLLRRKEEG